MYGIADFIYFVVYRLIGYRTKIVFENLSKSFPDKSWAELKDIEKKFYKHLADTIVEYIIEMRISVKEIQKRFIYTNPEILNKLYAEGKSIILVTGHYAAFEYLSSWPLVIKNYLFCPVYKPVKNPYFDKFIYNRRANFGIHPVAMAESYRFAAKQKQQNKRIALYLLADQLPPLSEMKYFTNFLNHEDTAIYLGPERIAKALDMGVVFLAIQQVKRGYYSATFEVLCENPKETAEYEITERHVRALEKQILDRPELWLWSHRRWKRTKQDVMDRAQQLGLKLEYS